MRVWIGMVLSRQKRPPAASHRRDFLCRPLSEWGGQLRWIETKVVHDTGTVSGYGLPTSSVPVPAA
jgi:hypothetical protein